MYRPIVVIFCALLLSALAQDAAAQGPYAPSESWWTGPIGQLGIQPDASGLNYEIDGDGDGMIEPGEPVHPIPQLVKNQLGFLQQRLSPSREFVYIFGSSGNCNGVSVYIYRIPSTNGAPLEPRVLGQCIRSQISQVGFYDVPTNPDVEYAYFVSGSNGFDQEIFWVELYSGTSAYSNNVVFAPNVVDITFEPNGAGAFVQHATSNLDGESNYTVVELCQDDFGSGSTNGSLMQVGGTRLDAESVVNGSALDIRITQNGTLIDQFAIDSCGAPTAPLGAACFSDGSCADNITEAAAIAAGGSWQGAGTTCASANCPPGQIPVPLLSAAGPSSWPVLSPMTYTLNYGNSGTGPMNNVVLNAVIPNGLNFVSVGNGGTYSSFIRRVSWNLGALAPGASGSVQFAVLAPCAITMGSLQSYFLTSDETTTIWGSPSVSTTFTSNSGLPLITSTTQTPDAGTPALNGETITNTIVLQNPDPSAWSDLSFTFFFGSGVDFVALTDSAGGTFTNTSFSGTWNGSISGGSTVTLSYQTRVQECRQAFVTETQLHNGNAFNIADACGNVAGTVTPGPAVPLGAAPLSVTASLSNVALWVAPPGAFWGSIALVRPDADVDVTMAATNNYGDTRTGVTLSVTLPSGMVPVGNPPFVGTVPQGATWNAVTGQANWTGDLGPNQTVSLTLRATYPGTAPACAGPMIVYGGYGSCNNAVSARTASLWSVPVASSSSQLYVQTPFDGTHVTGAGPSNVLSQLACTSFEIANGLDIAPDGDLWVAGTPSLRLDRDRLELDIFEYTYFEGAGYSTPSDVVVAVDGTAYFATNITSGPGAIVAMEPVNHGLSTVWEDSSNALGGTLHRIVLGDDGHLAATGTLGVVRVDPANPLAAVIYSDTPIMVQGYRAIAIDQDGHYLVMNGAGSWAVRPLVKIDRDTGVHTVEIADLNAMLTVSSPFYGMDVNTSSGEVYLASQSGPIINLDRGVPGISFVLGGSGQAQDVAFDAGMVPVSVTDIPQSRPTRVELAQNVPNPFNPRTTIRFALPADGPVSLAVLDLRGRLVKTLVDEVREAGWHEVVWNGVDQRGQSVASGIYFVSLQSLGVRENRKLVLTK